MSNDITALALIAKIKKQTESFDTVVLQEGEANALVEALEKAQQQIQSHERAELTWMNALDLPDEATRNDILPAIHAEKYLLRNANTHISKLERANAAQDNHINQQQDRIDVLEKRNAELGKYAGELELETQELRRILSGLPQYAIDGGWSAAGISAYAVRLESELQELRKFDQAKLINKFYERYQLETFRSDSERAEALGYYMAGAELQRCGEFIVYKDDNCDE